MRQPPAKARGTVKVLDFGRAKAIGTMEGDGFSRRQVAEAEASALQIAEAEAELRRALEQLGRRREAVAEYDVLLSEPTDAAEIKGAARERLGRLGKSATMQPRFH